MRQRKRKRNGSYVKMGKPVEGFLAVLLSEGCKFQVAVYNWLVAEITGWTDMIAKQGRCSRDSATQVLSFSCQLSNALPFVYILF